MTKYTNPVTTSPVMSTVGICQRWGKPGKDYGPEEWGAAASFEFAPPVPSELAPLIGSAPDAAEPAPRDSASSSPLMYDCKIQHANARGESCRRRIGYSSVRVGGCTHFAHGRTDMTIDPRFIPC